MGIRVVTGAGAARSSFSFWRATGIILGWLLTLGGLLVAVPMAGLLVATVALGTRNRDLGTQVLLLAAGSLAVFIGRRLIRGKRRLLLFLRRFGFAGSSRALTFAVGTAVGRRFRAVTLDDAELAPVGSRRWVRWLLAATSVVGVLVLISIVAASMNWLTGDALKDVFNKTFEGAQRTAVQRGDNPIGAFIGAIIGAIFVSLIVGMIALSVLTLFFAVVGSSAAVSASSWLGVLNAELTKRTTVRRPGEIDRAVRKVARRARGIFAPRLVVLRSATDVWRDTVRRLAGVADILLIDVSVPSDNLLWEIAVLKAEHGRWILIAQSDRMTELMKVPVRAAYMDRRTKLAELLDGEEVLTYDTTSRKMLRQFSQALRAKCENVARRGA